MSVATLPILPVAEKSLEVGADRGIQLPDPQGVEAVGSDGRPIPQGGFERVMEKMVTNSAALDNVADSQAAAFALGRNDDVHGTMVAAKKAEISIKLVGAVRTKLLDAFQELWRMNV